VPPDQVGGHGRPIPAAHHQRGEALPVQRVFQVVPHPAVDGDVRLAGPLDRHHVVERDPGRGHQRPAGLDDQIDVGAEVAVRGRHQPRGVVADARRGIGRHVTHPQAAAEVVHAEPLQPGQRGDLGLELVQGQDL
jgi:hypothetical protein